MKDAMKVVVIGLGSMGKRRIRLIRQYDSSIEIVGVDSRVDRRAEAEALYGVETAVAIEDCLKGVLCAFICTAPLTHHTLIAKCLSYGWHVFTELNLVADGYEKNMRLAKEKDLIIFLSSTLLYREETAYIGRRVSDADHKVNYTYHVGQYLPDWHPWESYKEFFVGNKETNGCREFFAIELPWIQSVFGRIKKIDVLKNKNSGLNIDYNDNYLLLIEHETGAKGTMAVDVISRKAVRNLEVFGEKIYLSWDGSPTGLYEYDIALKKDKKVHLYDTVDHLADYNRSIVENAYFSEVKLFFELMDQKGESRYGLMEDLETIEWLNRIEE